MTPKGTGSRPSQLSEEFVQDSSDESDKSENESESGSEDTSRSASDKASGARPTINGVNGASNEPSDGDGYDDDDGASSSSQEDETVPISHSKPIVSGNGKRPRELEDSALKDATSKQSKPSEPEEPAQPPEPSPIEAKPFTPPSGFQPLSLGSSDYASDAVGIFSDLKGKQIWHIAAPASLNIQKIKQFNIASALKGEPIFSDGHVSYTMHPFAEVNASVLLSESRDAVYEGTGSQVERAYQLQIIDNGENGNTSPSQGRDSNMRGDLVFTATALGNSRPPRQQPVGLRSRYTPFGVNQDRHLRTTSGGPGSISDLRNGNKISTRISRTASKPKDATESEAVDMDEEPVSTAKKPLGTSEKSAEPSPVKSTPAVVSADKKKKKKRSKLVDTPGI